MGGLGGSNDGGERASPKADAAQALSTAASPSSIPAAPSPGVESGILPRASSSNETRVLLDALPDGVMLLRGQSIVHVNSALVELLDYASAQEITTLPPLTFLSMHVVTEERQEAIDLMSVCLRGQQAHATDERRLVSRQRRQLYAHLTYRHVTFDGESSVMVSVRDFTASHDARKRLGHTDRMASIGSMAAGVAHEINNPLAYITTNVAYCVERIRYIEELLDENSAVQLDNPQSVRGLLHPLSQALTEAHQGTDKVSQLVRDLRSLTQDDSEFTPVDLGSVLTSAIHMSRSEYRYRARLVEDFKDAGSVRGNETRLVQLFLNLVVNAAQAFDSDSPETNKIVVRTFHAGENAVVEITDNGRGIPREVLPRVFDPFFTTRKVGQGTGLGLTICHTLVESMGGSLKLESKQGTGTTIRIELPRASGQSRPARPLSPSMVPDRRARVLIIDNEPLIIRAVGRLLAGEHDIDSAEDGVEGLQMLRYEGPFDVIVCDLMMPEMNGMELFRAVQKEMPEVAQKFVFLTGGAFTDQAARFLREVENPTLDKPLQPDLLRSVVGGVLGR